MKDELGGKIMVKFIALSAKTYSYLVDDGSEDTKAKGTKNCVIKRQLKFENYKNCLETTQLNNKTNVESFFCYKRKHKQFIKNNKLILKTRQRFKSESHNIFTEEINKIDLSSSDDERMQSIDSIKIYAYGTSKGLVNEKEEIQRKNIIKRYKND